LNLNEIWRLDALLDGSEVNAFLSAFRHKLLGQSSAVVDDTPATVTGMANDSYSSRSQAASKERKNSTKTDGVKFAAPPVSLPA
jgi:hypothetical protein